jgi:ribosomal protein RSM22 (predicted rRNA methylase)
MNLNERLKMATEVAGLGAIAHEKPGAWLPDAVVRLSLGLTRERALAGRPYLDDAELRAAYVAMYWPVSYLQTQEVFSIVGGTLGRVLDIGGGTGASAAAALDAGATSVTILDHAGDALGFCQTLFKGEPVETIKTNAEDFAPAKKFDTILGVHVLNELFGADEDRQTLLLATVGSWMEHLTPNGRLIIIEPALKVLGQDLLKIRDALVADGMHIHAPCFFQGACPALIDNDWCHTSLIWTPPHWVTRLADASNLDRTRVTMSYLVVGHKPVVVEVPEGASDIARVVSEPLHTKGRLRYLVCGMKGRYPIVSPESRVGDDTQAMKRLPPATVVEIGPTVTKGDGEDVSRGYVKVLERP